MSADADFTLGIEEEYLLVDPASGDLAEATDPLMEACKAALGDSVSPEFLRCQIEVGTPVAPDIATARRHLGHLRGSIDRIAAGYGLAPISVSCHPFADWHDQHQTDKDRYDQLSRDMRGVARRMLIGGMHVHVGLHDPDRRIALMNAFRAYLPHLLALSASSPFWQREDSGLASYRTTVFGGMPRTGLPPRFDGAADYDAALARLTDLGIIEDASKIWWDLRPSAKFPTLETRICDASPRLEDTITLAALIQSTLRMLARGLDAGTLPPPPDEMLLAENRWRAARHGTAEGLIEAGRIRPFDDIASDWLDSIAADAAALGCEAEIARLPDMLARGSSADRQRGVLAAALAAGASQAEGLRAVVTDLIEEFHRDLQEAAPACNTAARIVY